MLRAIHEARGSDESNLTLGPCSNGNMTGSTGVQVRVQSWTDFNQPDTLSYRGKSVAFSYDAGYKRVKEITTDGATVRTLFLVHPDNVGGLGFEREETRVSGGVTRNESRHYISVGGSVIAVVKTLNDSGAVSSDVNLTNYWHKDGLGSIVAVTNASGLVLERMAYDAWGRRQRDTGRVDPDIDPANGNRGFTGHEHLDELGLIHMNGRVYDPFLGRFLSADPIIEAEHLLQSYNRYSYVLNNPLRYTDPSGHCIDFCISAMVMMAVAGTALMVEGNQYWRMVGAIMTAYAIGPGGLAEAGLAQAGVTVTTAGSSAIAGGYVGLVSSGGDLSAGIQGAVFAAAFTTVGGSSLGPSAKVAAHALIGCLQGAASGGKCGPSAMAAAFGKFASTKIPPGFDAAGAVITAIAGGTASVIGGGKFANGALQAGFGYIFNALTMRQVAAMTTKGLALLSHEVAQYGFELIAPEVSFKGASGVNIRIDGVYMGSDGRILFGEAKVGNFADLTKNQKIGLPELQDGKGTFYGEHARVIAARLDVQPDASGRFTLSTTQIHGVYIGTYERSTSQTNRMQNINQTIKGRGFWPRSGDN